jgi:hypothetical protein
MNALESRLAAAGPFAETRLLAILDFIREPIDDVIHGMGGVEPFIVMVNGLYDTHVAPIDFPWVPNILEPALIDGPAKQIIAATIRRLHDRVHTE